MDGRKEGYAGAERASNHADRVSDEPLWSKIGWVRFLEYLIALRERFGPKARFTTEDFRDWVMWRSLQDPPDARAFGNITRIAAQKGIIVDTRERPRSKNPQTHGREVVLWEVV